MTVARRIVSGTFANIVGIAISAICQLISVPVLTWAWGLERYGLWLVLTTVPTYLALSDLGFASAATSDMTMQLARGRKEQVVSTFQSVWILANFVSVAAIIFTIAVFISFSGLSLWVREFGATLLLLVCYSGIAMNARILLSAFRATQNYALGTLLYDGSTLIETSAVLYAASAHCSFEQCAGTLIATRALCFVILFAVLRCKVPWLALDFTKASLLELKRLWRPAVAALAIPGSLAINLQGMIVVAGLFISASAAGVFAPVRTISRIAIQIVGAVNRATMPELSTANARDHRNALSSIIALNIATVIFVLLPGAIIFGIFGGKVVELWTNGKIHPDPSFVILIAIATVIHGLWYYASNILLAFNEHTRITRSLVTISFLSISATIPFSHFYGLFGLGLVIVSTELASLIVTAQTALRLELISRENIRDAFLLKIRRIHG